MRSTIKKWVGVDKSARGTHHCWLALQLGVCSCEPNWYDTDSDRPVDTKPVCWFLGLVSCGSKGAPYTNFSYYQLYLAAQQFPVSR